MPLDPDLKDNLTLMGGQQGPRYLTPLLVLLAIVVIAVVIFYAYFHQPHPEITAAETVKKPAVSAKTEQKMLDAVKIMIASNNVMLARQTCYDLLQNVTRPEVNKEAEKLLGQLNINLAMSPARMTEKMEYIVQPGDTLEQLAKKHGTTVDMINKCNSLQGRTIHPGDRLLIFNAKLAIIISKSQNNLLLKANDRFFKRYAVGTGKFGTTPSGTFVISDKIIEPPWWRPDGRMIPYGDKENVLGTRWMTLTATGTTPKVRGYGIHGTGEPETVGKQASAGCVRLLNADVEELFTFVPLGTPVTIME
jgi:lipoprotein-anchoring transpeptidase ErfK/SrfK